MRKICSCASLKYDQLHSRLNRCKHGYSSSTYAAFKYLSAVKGAACAILLRGKTMLTTHVGCKAWPLRVLPGWTASLAPLQDHCQRHTCKTTCNMRQSRLCSKTHDTPSTCSTAPCNTALIALNDLTFSEFSQSLSIYSPDESSTQDMQNWNWIEIDSCTDLGHAVQQNILLPHSRRSRGFVITHSCIAEDMQCAVHLSNIWVILYPLLCLCLALGVSAWVTYAWPTHSSKHKKLGRHENKLQLNETELNVQCSLLNLRHPLLTAFPVLSWTPKFPCWCRMWRNGQALQTVCNQTRVCSVWHRFVLLLGHLSDVWLQIWAIWKTQSANSHTIEWTDHHQIKLGSGVIAWSNVGWVNDIHNNNVK